MDSAFTRSRLCVPHKRLPTLALAANLLLIGWTHALARQLISHEAGHTDARVLEVLLVRWTDASSMGVSNESRVANASIVH